MKQGGHLLLVKGTQDSVEVEEMKNDELGLFESYQPEERSAQATRN